MATCWDYAENGVRGGRGKATHPSVCGGEGGGDGSAGNGRQDYDDNDNGDGGDCNGGGDGGHDGKEENNADNDNCLLEKENIHVRPPQKKLISGS